MIASIVALTFVQVSGPANAKDALNVGVATWAGFGNGFIGKKDGYWPNLDVSTQVIDDARAREASFGAGQTDVMISSVDLFAQESANGIAGRIIVVTDISNGGDGIVAKSEISSVRELKGRKIAVTVGAPSEFLLYTLLKQVGLSLSDVQIVRVDDPQKAAEVYMSGDVDAAVTWEPFLSQAAGRPGAKVLVTSREAPNTIVDVLIASPRLLAKRAVLDEFVTGWLRAAEDIRAKREGATTAIATGFNVGNDDIEGMLAGIKIAGYPENATFFSGPSAAETPLGKLFTETGQLWVSIGLIKKATPAKLNIDTSLLPLFQKGPKGK
jgi:NitT/TauT family transport system substrate-binding protein